MGDTHLSLPLQLPNGDCERYERLDKLIRHISTCLLERYWTHDQLDGIRDASYQVWTYFDEHEAFETIDLYLPSRVRRCILQKVGETLRSQADRRAAFRAIQAVLPEHKIRRIHRRRIKQTLWDDGAYLTSGYVDGLIEQLNAFYDRHGTIPRTISSCRTVPPIRLERFRIGR